MPSEAELEKRDVGFTSHFSPSPDALKAELEKRDVDLTSRFSSPPDAL